MAIVIKYFRVYATTVDSAGVSGLRPISAKYTVKDAAQQFADLARAGGQYPDAHVRTVTGCDKAPEGF